MPTVTGGSIPSGDEILWFIDTGTTITDEAVGTGDGTTTTFSLDYPSVDYTEVVKVATVTKTQDTDYTMSYANGVSTIVFTAAPAGAAAITCTYTKGIEFAASSEVSIEFSHEVMERSVHGSTTKLTKTGVGSATASLTDVLVDGAILGEFVGSITTADGDDTFSWSGAAPGTVANIYGKTIRAGTIVLRTFMVNAKITDGSLDYPEDDFSSASMEFTIDNFRMIYNTPA